MPARERSTAAEEAAPASRRPGKKHALRRNAGVRDSTVQKQYQTAHCLSITVHKAAATARYRLPSAPAQANQEGDVARSTPGAGLVADTCGALAQRGLAREEYAAKLIFAGESRALSAAKPHTDNNVDETICR